jgi:C4-dicarboxylate-specific signal transduction histidine kinase
VAASHARVTSASNASTSALPQDKSCRDKIQEEMKERGGRQWHTGKISLSFSD